MNEKEIKKILCQLDSIKIPDKQKIISVCENNIEAQSPLIRSHIHTHPQRRRLLTACVCSIILISILTLSAFAILEQKQQTDEIVVSQVHNDVYINGKPSEKGESFTYKTGRGYIDNSNSMKDYTLLEKYHDGELVWDKMISGFYAKKLEYSEEYIVVGGISEDNPKNYSVLLLSQDGNILWQNPTDDISCFIIEKDKITVIGNGANETRSTDPRKKTDLSKLYIAEFDISGTLIRSVSESFKNLGFDYIKCGTVLYGSSYYSVTNAIKVENDYYLVLTNEIVGIRKEMSVAKVSAQGRFKAMFEISRPSISQRITDIAVDGDTLYIGGYYIPSENGPYMNGLLIDTYKELDIIEEMILSSEPPITDQELLEALSSYYTAFTVCFDVDTGKYKNAWIAEGAKDSVFTKDRGGRLLWNYKTITQAKYTTIPADYPFPEDTWKSPTSADIEIVYKKTFSSLPYDESFGSALPRR